MAEGIRRALDYRPNRVRRKLIILGTEGNNKTEKLYFAQLEKKQNKYHFIFTSSNNTDAIGIVNSVSKEAKKQEINRNDGDFCAALFDVDVDPNKISTINKVVDLATKKNVNLYTSNPCFELWYILHFIYSTKAYSSSNEVIKELKKYIPNYKKNRCDFNIFDSLSYKAIANAKQMQLSVCCIGSRCKTCITSNPNTDVYKLVEMILPKLKKGGKEY